MLCLLTLEALLGWNIDETLTYLVTRGISYKNTGQVIAYNFMVDRGASWKEYRSNFTYLITRRQFLAEI